MTPHVDILEQPERLRKPLLASLVLHAGAFAGALAFTLAGGGARQPFGSPNSGGPGSVAVNVVNRIPLPSRGGLVNPLARDTESLVPEPPPKAKPQERAPEPEPDAIPIKSRTAPKRPAPKASAGRYRAQPEAPNQVYSTAGQALSSPMVGQTGSGGVGVGEGSAFGTRFAYYEQLLKEQVARKWQTGDVDPRLRTAPPVIVTFTILRDGSARNVRVAQRSGNAALDYSAQRAILDASPFPPLPQGFEHSEAHIEFWFELRR
jgi:protein TonB